MTRTCAPAIAASQVLGALARESGGLHDARTHLQHALLLAERAGDTAAEAGVLVELATTLLELGRLPEAGRAYSRAMDLDRGVGAGAREALAATNLAVVEHLQGKLARAERRQRRALAVHRRTGNQRLTGFSLGALGALALERNELAEAERLLLEAEATLDGVDPLLHAYALVGLTLVWNRLGDTERASDALARVAAALQSRAARRLSVLELVASPPDDGDELPPLDGFSRLALRLVRTDRQRGAQD